MKRSFLLQSLSMAMLAYTLISSRGAGVTIEIQDLAFVPQNRTVNMGDIVTWMNNDTTSHTSTSGQGGTPDGMWDSGALAPGASFSRTFDLAGTFPYLCSFHPFMTGSITVVQPQSNPPTVSITSPANNASFAAPGNVTIEAAATAAGGATIAQVEFFDAANSLGIDTSSPYSVVANLGAGTHSLTAKATDSAGATAVSSVVTVSVGGGGTKIDDPIPEKIQKGNITIELEKIATGLISPIGMAAPDDGSGRLFVCDQVGFVYVFKDGKKMETPLIDVRDRLVPLNPKYDERGLIGLATHPNFSQHPFIYTYTSEPNGPMADFMIMMDGGKTNDHQSVIAEWKIDAANPDRIDPASRREILRVDKPQSNHNGGTMRFGPDGFLYFTIGDGGAADDQGDGHSPGGNGQDRTKILGKVSRIDVDSRDSANGQYGVPSDNPFINEPGSVHEIYAWGLRNPYSFSFDKKNGDLFLADVGQNDVEEVDIIKKGGNYGWSIKEGSFFFDANGTNNGFVTSMPVRDVPADLIDPIAEFDHDEGDAIVGGYVYRGTAIPSLSGKYVSASWGEFGSPAGRLFFLDGSKLKEFRIGAEGRQLGMWVKGFGEDPSGELYVMGSTDLGPSGSSGRVLKLVPAGIEPSRNTYVQQNLVSDLSGMAPVTDANLVNPWGLAFGPNTFFWISDNGTGVSTLYDGTGAPQSLVATIPTPPGGQPPAAPTGAIFNNTSSFKVGAAPAKFIFATEDGTIAGWNAGGQAVLGADNSAGAAIYKGLTIAKNGADDLLFAANFHAGQIDVFDSAFHMITPAGGAFNDPDLPAGFAPFNVREIGGSIFVTYAMQDADKEDDVRGPGNGFIDVFDSAGKMLRRFASAGVLNSPWGLAVAPANFGAFGGALLVGNFGDGHINAFDLVSGAFLGQLKDPAGKLITIEGLWDLKFGNGTKAGDPNKLYFTAGISGGAEIEDHGLFGSLSFNIENRYIQRNLVSDLAAVAPVTDPNLANPWGLAFGPSTFFWVADNHTGFSTLYDGAGAAQSLVVMIPPPPGAQPPAAPTGAVFNDTGGFEIGGAPAKFLFATEDGTITGWSTGTNAMVVVDNSAADAIYKGLTIAGNGGSNLLYAADFKGAKIDVFDSEFKPATLAGGFNDPTIPAGFAPFDIRTFEGSLFVTYALQDAEKEDDVAALGNGFINVFDTSGNLLRRFASNGTLNSPWGLTMAPPSFGAFGGTLLVGNFGDGHINAFDPISGAFLGQLEDTNGLPIKIEGLWDLRFGNGTKAGDADKLYFTAGIPGGGALEDHGLFGSLSFEASLVITRIERNGNTVTITWSGGTGPFMVQKKSSLSDTTWSDVQPVSGTSATVPIEGGAGFFRVVSQENTP